MIVISRTSPRRNLDADDEEDSGWEDTECIPDSPADVTYSQGDRSFGGSFDIQSATFSHNQVREQQHPDQANNRPSAFGLVNVMNGSHGANVSQNEAAFTEIHMQGYKNVGQRLSLNAQFC